MAKAALEQSIGDYLKNHNTLSLATVGVDGLPHACSLFYVNIGFDLYFLSSPVSRHGLNMAQNPRVFGTINEDYREWRHIKGLQVEGLVSPLGGILEHGRISLLFIKKFPDVTAFFSSPRKLGEAIFRKVEGVQFYRISPRQNILHQ